MNLNHVVVYLWKIINNFYYFSISFRFDLFFINLFTEPTTNSLNNNHHQTFWQQKSNFFSLLACFKTESLLFSIHVHLLSSKWLNFICQISETAHNNACLTTDYHRRSLTSIFTTSTCLQLAASEFWIPAVLCSAIVNFEKNVYKYMTFESCFVFSIFRALVQLILRTISFTSSLLFFLYL